MKLCFVSTAQAVMLEGGSFLANNKKSLKIGMCLHKYLTREQVLAFQYLRYYWDDHIYMNGVGSSLPKCLVSCPHPPPELDTHGVSSFLSLMQRPLQYYVQVCCECKDKLDVWRIKSAKNIYDQRRKGNCSC